MSWNVPHACNSLEYCLTLRASPPILESLVEHRQDEDAHHGADEATDSVDAPPVKQDDLIAAHVEAHLQRLLIFHICFSGIHPPDI